MGEENEAAEEIRRLRTTIRNIVWGVVTVAVLVTMWLVVQSGTDNADRNAEELVECVKAGRSDC